MILTLKRIVAKIIDLVLFSIVSFFLTVLISFIFSSFINENSPLIEWISNAPNTDMEAMILYFEQNRKYTIYLSSIGSILMLINGFVYFGAIGKKCRGSLGKYAMHIEVINENNDANLSIVKLFLREPFMHYIVTSVLISFVSLFYPPIGLLSQFIIYIYIFSLILNKDFWNKLLKFKII